MKADGIIAHNVHSRGESTEPPKAPLHDERQEGHVAPYARCISGCAIKRWSPANGQLLQGARLFQERRGLRPSSIEAREYGTDFANLLVGWMVAPFSKSPPATEVASALDPSDARISTQNVRTHMLGKERANQSFAGVPSRVKVVKPPAPVAAGPGAWPTPTEQVTTWADYATDIPSMVNPRCHPPCGCLNPKEDGMGPDPCLFCDRPWGSPDVLTAYFDIPLAMLGLEVRLLLSNLFGVPMEVLDMESDDALVWLDHHPSDRPEWLTRKDDR